MRPATRFLPLLLGVISLLGLAWWFGLGALESAMRRLSIADLVAYVALTAAIVLAYAARWRLAMRSVGRELPLRRLASARLAGDAVGNLLPSAKLAGEPVRVAVVYGDGIDGSTAAAGVTFDRLLEVAGNLVCAIAYVSIFLLVRSVHDGARASVAALATALVVGAVAFALPLVMLRLGVRPLGPIYALVGRLRRRHPPSARLAAWVATLERAEDHLMTLFRERPWAFVAGLAATLGIEALTIAQYHLLFRAFGVVVDLPTLLLALVGSGVARAVPAPAALGSLEGTQVAVFALAEGEPAVGFLVGLVMRFHETLLLAAGLAALSWHGLSLARLPRPRASGEASA